MIRLLLTRIVPLLVLLVALFVGWLSRFPIPEAVLFAMAIPLTKGYLPVMWTGGFKESLTPPLSELDALILDPRPANENFIQLPGVAEKEVAEEEEGQEDAFDAHDVEAALDEYAAFQMPQQGLGMCCRPSAYDPESVRRTILWYLKLGGRHIDTADLYLNHAWIGEALQTAMNDFGIAREDIWITTKLWPRHYGPNATAVAVERMLKELKLDYVDLVLMHAPSMEKFLKPLGAKAECDVLKLSAKECRQETWKALSSVRATGQVHHIGVSNFNVRQLQDLQALGDAVAPIANNQFQYNPWVPEYQHETFDYCQQHGIAVTAYASFAGSFMQHMQAFSVETLQRIANHHTTTVPQILLTWAMQKGAIVIPGTGNPKHMAENLKAYDIELTAQDMADIDTLRNDESAKQFFIMPPDDS